MLMALHERGTNGYRRLGLAMWCAGLATFVLVYCVQGLLPALAGIALAPVFFLLARRVLPTERAALFASFLLLCDGVYLVQSRVAMFAGFRSALKSRRSMSRKRSCQS